MPTIWIVQYRRRQSAIDPKITAKYLRALPGVLDAEVWIERGELRARIVVENDSWTAEQDVRELCAYDLGWSYAPRRIKFESPAADTAA